MKNIILFLFVFFSQITWAALSDLDKADLSSTNILKNSGFESGFAEWSKTGGSWTLQTSGSKLGFGKQSLCWDSSAAAQKLQSSLVAIPNALKGKNGEAKISILTPTGTATHKLRVTDGTNTIGGSGNEISVVTLASGFQQHSINVPIPTSGSMRFELESVASNEPEICLDIGYLGEATNLQTMALKNLYSAKITLSGVVSRENMPWIDSCTNANPVVCTFKAGVFTSVPNCSATTEDTIADAYQTITAISTSSISIQSGNFLESVLQRTDRRDFTLTCSKSVDSQIAVNSLQGDYGLTAWTPTFTTVSPSVVEMYHSRQGEFLYIQGKIVHAGGTGALTFTLPNGLVASSSKLTAASNYQVVGTGSMTTTTLGSITILAQAGLTTLAIGADGFGGGGNAPYTGAWGSETMTFFAKVPIQEWQDTQKAPILVGSVTSGTPIAERIERAKINNSGSCSVGSQSGTWISSINRPSGGICDITFASGYFSAAPACTCTSESGSGYLCIISTTSTTSGISIETANTSGVIDANFDIICMGPK